MPTDRIGTGQTYTTIGAWEAAIVTGVLTEDVIGECMAEEFVESVLIDGVTTDNGYYVRLRAEVGAEHDGRAHAVSGAGNARTVSTAGTTEGIRIVDALVEVCWMEVQKTASGGGIQHDIGAAGGLIHHNISWYSGASPSSASRGISGDNNGGQVYYAYRNIVYGFGDGGMVNRRSDATTQQLFNTVYYCARHGGPVDPNMIKCSGASVISKDNVAFKGPGQAALAAYNATGTWDNNASNDTSTTEVALRSLAPLNELINVTDDFNYVDLRIKSNPLKVGRYSYNSYSTVTFPEINKAISSRYITIGDLPWSVGADEILYSPMTQINILIS